MSTLGPVIFKYTPSFCLDFPLALMQNSARIKIIKFYKTF